MCTPSSRPAAKRSRISPGEVFRVEHLPGERGDIVVLGEVLLVGDGPDIKVGRPLVENATVQTVIVRQGKAKKIIVSDKKKRRKNYRRKQGHRQLFTALQVQEIIL